MSSQKKIIMQEESSVINFLEPAKVQLINQPMCKVEDFLITLKCRLLNFQRSTWNEPAYESHKQWFNEGYSAEVLDVSASGWKKGKVRINVSVEFISDELEEESPKSPLDDIRQSISENQTEVK